MDQKSRNDDRRQVDRPVHREVVRAITSRCRTHESIGRGGYIFGVEWRGENRWRGVNGQWDGGGSNNETNRVCGIILWGVEERGEDTVVGGVKEVYKDDDERREDIIDIHGGRWDRMW